MRCATCGAELEDGEAVCPACGAPVEAEAEVADAAAEPSEPEGTRADEGAPRHLDPETTRFVSYAGDDPTRIARLSGGEETRVSRRREETVLAGETTLLEHEDADEGFEDDWEPEGDGLDVPVEPAPRYAEPAPREPEAPTPRPQRTMSYVFIAIAAVVVAAVLGAFVTWRMELWGGVSVPDVMGLSESEATATLTEAGFQVEVTAVVVDEGAGTVVSMQPQAGRRVALGRVVEIGVGVLRTVPDIEGLALAEARQKLAASGIEHVRLEYQNAPEPKGTVIAVSPVAGSRVGAEDVVTVVVAQPYTVPDVVGLTESAALASLERAGLAGSVSYVPSEDVEAGRVVATDPGAGTELAEGGSVVVSVSSPYPKDAFDVDGLLGFKPEDVADFLAQVGFSVTYAKVDDGALTMAFEPLADRAPAEDGIEVLAVGFSPLPFSIPGGFQLFPRNYLQEGVAPQGACVALGDAEGASALALDQDSVTEIMNLCGLRSESGATTTAAGDGVADDGQGEPRYVAKASTMGDNAWYVVVWEAPASPMGSLPLVGGEAGSETTLRAMAGIAPKASLETALEDAGIRVGDYDSMAELCAELVIGSRR